MGGQSLGKLDMAGAAKNSGKILLDTLADKKFPGVDGDDIIELVKLFESKNRSKKDIAVVLSKIGLDYVANRFEVDGDDLNKLKRSLARRGKDIKKMAQSLAKKTKSTGTWIWSNLKSWNETRKKDSEFMTLSSAALKEKKKRKDEIRHWCLRKENRKSLVMCCKCRGTGRTKEPGTYWGIPWGYEKLTHESPKCSGGDGCCGKGWKLPLPARRRLAPSFPFPDCPDCRGSGQSATLLIFRSTCSPCFGTGKVRH